MNTIEEFQNAPVGATATGPDGGIAFKTGRPAFEWKMFDAYWNHCDNRRSDELAGYTLNPTAPTSAQEALDLAWELAHPLKEGQHIPEDTRLLERPDYNNLSAYTTQANITINARESLTIRTLDPLEPNPYRKEQA